MVAASAVPTEPNAVNTATMVRRAVETASRRARECIVFLSPCGPLDDSLMSRHGGKGSPRRVEGTGEKRAGARFPGNCPDNLARKGMVLFGYTASGATAEARPFVPNSRDVTVWAVRGASVRPRCVRGRLRRSMAAHGRCRPWRCERPLATFQRADRRA